MGLDMYLEAERDADVLHLLTDKQVEYYRSDGEVYISGWDHRPDTNYMAVLDAAGLTRLRTDDSPHAEVYSDRVASCCAYWRKANAIHSWFVQNIQGGVDNCGRYEISWEQIAHLLD